MMNSDASREAGAPERSERGCDRGESAQAADALMDGWRRRYKEAAPGSVIPQ
jgi:hypothetical protein